VNLDPVGLYSSGLRHLKDRAAADCEGYFHTTWYHSGPVNTPPADVDPSNPLNSHALSLISCRRRASRVVWGGASRPTTYHLTPFGGPSYAPEGSNRLEIPRVLPPALPKVR